MLLSESDSLSMLMQICRLETRRFRKPKKGERGNNLAGLNEQLQTEDPERAQTHIER